MCRVLYEGGNEGSKEGYLETVRKGELKNLRANDCFGDSEAALLVCRLH